MSFQNLRTTILVHITDFNAADSILSSGVMRCSKQGMLGPGVYFAENKEAANKKAHRKGAIVISAVNLGKLYEVYGPNRQLTLKELKNQNFDSVRGYKSNSPECKNFNTGTEFCVFEENRITPLFAQYIKADGSVYYKIRTDRGVIQRPSFPLERLVINITENNISICDTEKNVYSTITHYETLMRGRKVIFTNEGEFEFTKVIHRLR